jgi:hypothetical protein
MTSVFQIKWGVPVRQVAEVQEGLQRNKRNHAILLEALDKEFFFSPKKTWNKNRTA